MGGCRGVGGVVWLSAGQSTTLLLSHTHTEGEWEEDRACGLKGNVLSHVQQSSARWWISGSAQQPLTLTSSLCLSLKLVCGWLKNCEALNFTGPDPNRELNTYSQLCNPRTRDSALLNDTQLSNCVQSLMLSGGSLIAWVQWGLFEDAFIVRALNEQDTKKNHNASHPSS